MISNMTDLTNKTQLVSELESKLSSMTGERQKYEKEVEDARMEMKILQRRNINDIKDLKLEIAN